MINSTKMKVITMLQNVLRYLFPSTIRLFLLFICIGVATTPLYTGMPMGGFPGGLPDLSPEELQALEQELEQAAQAIDQYVSSLSPAEQEAFHQEVARVEQLMSGMSPEELEQFFGEMLAQELANQGQEMPVPAQSAPIMQPKTEPTPEIKPKITTSEQEAALALLDSIIQHTDEFLIKTNNIPDLSIRVKRWITGQKIHNASTDSGWESIKAAIEAFKQKLYRLKEVNPKTNQYTFVSLLTKNTSLYEMLTSLESTLTTHEPKLSVSSFGIEELNSESKRALVVIINAYNALLASATTEIDKLFEEYAPEAQKLKDAEIKAAEQARAEASKPRTPKAPRVGGSRESENRGQYTQAGSDYGDYGYGYGPSYGPSYGRAQEGGSPTTKKSKDKKPSSSGGGGRGYPGAQNTTKEEEEKKKKEEEEKKKKEAGQVLPMVPGTQPTDQKTEDKKDKDGKPLPKPTGAKTSQAPRVVCPVNQSSDNTLQLIKSNLDQATEIIKEENAIHSLETELTSQTPPNMHLALVTLPGLERRAKRVDDLVTQYLTAHGNDDEAKQNVQSLLNSYESFTKVTAELQRIKTAVADDAFLQKIPAAKQYAYFAQQPELKEDADTKALDAIKKSVPHPTSLITIANVLENIKAKAYVNPLSPAEQEPFHKEVTDIEQEIEQPEQKSRKKVKSKPVAKTLEEIEEEGLDMPWYTSHSVDE